jgi:hypothetical protein
VTPEAKRPSTARNSSEPTGCDGGTEAGGLKI